MAIYIDENIYTTYHDKWKYLKNVAIISLITSQDFIEIIFYITIDLNIKDNSIKLNLSE